MEKGNFIHLVFVIDESGSMYPSVSDVVNGFKQMIDEQKKVKEGKCSVSLYTFADSWKEVYLGKDVSEIDDIQYHPNGLTAMNDGIGVAIDRVGKWLSDMDEKDRPSKNLVIIMTDGEENNSKEYSLDRVKEMIKHQTEKYSWDFMYIGTDITTKKDANRLGVTKMSKSHAVIRRLTAVETLGCTQTICSDKTGTLTRNQMTAVEHTGDTKMLATAMALCCDAMLNTDDTIEGEPTEAALVAFAKNNGLRKYELEKELPRVEEAPFDSTRKMMTTVHQRNDGTWIAFTKGAPDAVIALCTKQYVDGKEASMRAEDHKKAVSDNKNMADRALRVLCAAYRIYETMPEDVSPQALEQDLTYIGLVGMIDPVRDEVIPAIQQCRSAGIRPVMITGDHKDTAVAIGKQIGIIDSELEAVTGAQLDEMSDEQLEADIAKYGVYARVKPEHKVRIVIAWKKRGAITAMTGDGVNDAPSIKTADIGIGMGITGTDVTKNVADMILTDDNFATIVNAVEEGRKIYDNIRKAVQFLLSSNMSEVIGVFVSSLMGFTLLKPVHLLFINLITDCLPALALGMEEAEENIMNRKPRDAKDSIFADGMIYDVIYQGALIAGLTVLSYILGHYFETGIFEIPPEISPHGMTMAFLTMNMCEIFHSYNMRSLRGSIFSLKNHNRLMWVSMIAAVAIVTVVLEIPFIAGMFGFTPVGINEYATAIGLAFLVIPIVEMIKFIQRKVK